MSLSDDFVFSSSSSDDGGGYSSKSEGKSEGKSDGGEGDSGDSGSGVVEGDVEPVEVATTSPTAAIHAPALPERDNLRLFDPSIGSELAQLESAVGPVNSLLDAELRHALSHSKDANRKSGGGGTGDQNKSRAGLDHDSVISHAVELSHSDRALGVIEQQRRAAVDRKLSELHERAVELRVRVAMTDANILAYNAGTSLP